MLPMLASPLVVEMSDTLEYLRRLAVYEVTVAPDSTAVNKATSRSAARSTSRTEASWGRSRSSVDAINTLAEGARRTTDSLRKGHAADRTMLIAALQQHARRLHEVETES